MSDTNWSCTYSLTYLLNHLQLFAHDTDTKDCHRGLSTASFAIWPHPHPRALLSLPMYFLHAAFGRPLLLFPAWVQRMATLTIDVSGILLTCPIPLYLLLLTSNEICCTPVRSGALHYIFYLAKRHA